MRTASGDSRSELSSPTAWFAVLEGALRTNDFELAARAKRKLSEMGVEVRVGNPRWSQENADYPLPAARVETPPTRPLQRLPRLAAPWNNKGARGDTARASPRGLRRSCRSPS
jgi:hypothetical protein